MGMFRALGQDKYDRQYSDAYLYGRLWDYMRPMRSKVIATVAASLLVSVSLAVVPILIADAVELLGNDSALGLLIVYLVALALSLLLRYAANWWQRRTLGRVVSEITAQMRKDAFRAAIYRDMAFYDENKTGKVLSRITSDTQEFATVFVSSFQIVAQLVQMVFLLAVLFIQSPFLTLILLGFMPVILAIALIFRAVARNVTRQGARAMAAVNDNIQESVTGISVAKNFRQEAAMYQAFTDVNTQSYRINLRRGFVFSLIFPVFNAVAGMSIGGLLYIGAVAFLNGSVDVGAYFLFIQASDRYWFPVIELTAFYNQFQQAMADLERLFALIDAENLVKQTASEPAGDLKGRIEFEGVRFEYLPDQPVLPDFRLEIQPGESVALVGHTGAGKSSIIKLLTRFYEFQAGQIRIDGRDIRRFEIQDYRRRLGLVPQTPFLFNTSIRENIRYARPEASDAEIEEIAYSIGGGEWLENLPERLETPVGERGAHLSMGQRQLVALLRVLVQKPAIFILDEATASIDPFTESQIQEALDLILKRSTSILIAHRLSTVRSADRIIVLKQGQIIEQGSHDSLMQQGGHYAELYSTYFRHQSLNYVEQSRADLGSAAR